MNVSRKYPDFIIEYQNYSLAIKNRSKPYIENVSSTIMDFLSFVNKTVLKNKYTDIYDYSIEDLRNLTHIQIYSYMCYLITKGQKKSTRRTKLENLTTFFNYLYKIRKTMFSQPFKQVSRERSETRILPNSLTEGDARKLLELYADSDKAIEIRDNAILHIFLTCGLRVSEISNLKISDINFNDFSFRIVGKGNKERISYLNKQTRKEVLKYLEIRKKIKVKSKKDEDILFISNKRFKLAPRTIRTLVKKAYKLAGIECSRFSVHTLRHTCATLLFKAGNDLLKIQQVLGHVKIQTTELYTHLFNEKIKETMLEHPLAHFKMKDALSFKYEQPA